MSSVSIRLRWLIIFLILVAINSQAQNRSNNNVLSYYAVTNSIDGQPLIDKVNTLRFYPVFALRDSIEYVRVTVYYGNEISIEDAVKLKNGLYWESKLPNFKLGDAIQRYEVETGLSYDLNFKKTLDDFRDELDSKKKALYDSIDMLNMRIKKGELRKIIQAIDIIIENQPNIRVLGESASVSSRIQLNNDLVALKEQIAEIYNLSKEIRFPKKSELRNFRLEGISIQVNQPVSSNSNTTSISLRNGDPILNDADQVKMYFTDDRIKANVISKQTDTFTEYDYLKTGNSYSYIDAKSNQFKQDTINIRNNAKTLKRQFENLNAQIENLELIENNWIGVKGKFEGFKNSIQDLLEFKSAFSPLAAKQEKDLIDFINSQEYVSDSLKGNLIRQLSDKEFSGSGIQKSDIVYYNNYKSIKILYRNYRQANRTLVALDPAEQLSIFRLRYVPFPIVGNELKGPSRDGVPVVFEAGITFGNQVITNNEFLKPELSIQRLGLAVALTPKLFNENAEVLALLFTYDFNAYASIGVGANFGSLSPTADPYFSFGINQKAFQALVLGIGNIFGG